MKKIYELLASITALVTVILMLYNCYDVISRSAYDSVGMLSLALSGLIMSAGFKHLSERY